MLVILAKEVKVSSRWLKQWSFDDIVTQDVFLVTFTKHGKNQPSKTSLSDNII